jgi:hypothetical protein
MLWSKDITEKKRQILCRIHPNPLKGAEKKEAAHFRRQLLIVEDHQDQKDRGSKT